MTDHDDRVRRIREAFARIKTIRGTARDVGCDRITVRAALGIVRRRKKAPSAPKRPTKIEPFLPMLRRLVIDDQLTGVLAFEELKTAGYSGSYSRLKVEAAKFRPKLQPTVTTVVEHAPGAEGQVDWSPYQVFMEVEGERRLVHAFSMVLPFSRWMWVRFAFDEQLDTLLRFHEEAFADLDAVPNEMTYDNMTTVGRHIGPDEVWINAQFAAWAKPYEFSIRLTRPGCPNDHASVERPFHYIEHNCLLRRRSRFADLDDLNRHAKWWCDEVANVRIHGTMRRRPIDVLRFERSFLMPLPSARPEPYRTVVHKVRSDFCVPFDTHGYSVSPRHVGKDVTMRIYPHRVEIILEGEVLATHVRSFARMKRSVLPEHEAEFLRLTPSRRLLEGAFLRLGPTAETFYQGLLQERGQGAGYHLRRILKLADRRGTSVVIAAMAHAAKYGNYNADAVVRVITGRDPPPEAVATPQGEAPMPPARVKAWLEGLYVEQSDLSEVDRRIDQHGSTDDEEE